jgi:Flp pilus assembly protein TadB
MQELEKYKKEQQELERMRIKETSSQQSITQAAANYLLYIVIVLILIAAYVQTIGFSIFTLIVLCIFLMVYVSFYHGLWIIMLSLLYYYFYVLV